MTPALFADTLIRLGALVRAAFGLGADQPRLRLRRGLVMLLFLPVLVVVQAIHWLFLLLDEVLYPDFRARPITAPVVVLGMPRSGTTFLHRVLARDPGLTTFRTWECLLAPSITQRRVILALAGLDRRLGGPAARGLAWLERRVFAGLDDIHAMDLMAPEEDYFALLPVLACFVLVIPFPGAAYLWQIGGADRLMAAEARARLMAFYTDALKRHLYVAGPDKRLLTKNAAFAGLAGSLRETLPDARVLCCLRDPVAVVASQLSSIQGGVALFDSDPDGQLFADRMVPHLAGATQTLMAACPDAGLAPGAAGGSVRVDMAALNRDLAGTIGRAYDRLGLPMTPAFARALAEEAAAARRYRSRHRYSLADFALDEETVLRHFRDAPADAQTPASAGASSAPAGPVSG